MAVGICCAVLFRQLPWAHHSACTQRVPGADPLYTLFCPSYVLSCGVLLAIHYVHCLIGLLVLCAPTTSIHFFLVLVPVASTAFLFLHPCCRASPRASCGRYPMVPWRCVATSSLCGYCPSWWMSGPHSKGRGKGGSSGCDGTLRAFPHVAKRRDVRAASPTAGCGINRAGVPHRCRQAAAPHVYQCCF